MISSLRKKNSIRYRVHRIQTATIKDKTKIKRG